MARPPTTSSYSPEIIGDTGLRQTGGYVYEEFLKELQGLRGIRAYREMADNDATCGAVLFAITTLIRQAEWSVQGVDDTPEGEAAKEFVEECLEDMSVPFGDVIAEACTMFTYGFAPMEIVWKRRGGPDIADPTRKSAYTDNKIGIRKIFLIGQPTLNRWDIDEEGGIQGIHQQPFSGGAVFVPIEKLLLFRTTAVSNNPEGRSILRSAYRSYYMKKRIEEIEAVGVERDLAGLPIAYVPGSLFSSSADPEEKARLAGWQRLVTSIRRDQREGVVVPSDRDQTGNLLYELKLLSTAGSRSFDTTKVIDRYNRAIATSVLADFIFLGQQAVGSFALSSDKTALFAQAVGAFTKAISDTLNRHLIPRLWKLNGLPPEFMPKIVCADLENANLGEVAALITALTGAGAQMFPDRDLENHLRGMAGLPLASEEEDLGADQPNGPDDPDEEDDPAAEGAA